MNLLKQNDIEFDNWNKLEPKSPKIVFKTEFGKQVFMFNEDAKHMRCYYEFPGGGAMEDAYHKAFKIKNWRKIIHEFIQNKKNIDKFSKWINNCLENKLHIKFREEYLLWEKQMPKLIKFVVDKHTKTEIVYIGHGVFEFDRSYSYWPDYCCQIIIRMDGMNKLLSKKNFDEEMKKFIERYEKNYWINENNIEEIRNWFKKIKQND